MDHTSSSSSQFSSPFQQNNSWSLIQNVDVWKKNKNAVSPFVKSLPSSSFHQIRFLIAFAIWFGPTWGSIHHTLTHSQGTIQMNMNISNNVDDLNWETFSNLCPFSSIRVMEFESISNSTSLWFKQEFVPSRCVPDLKS